MASPSASSSSAHPSSTSTQTVLALVVATLIGAGGGGFLGMTLVGDQPAAPARSEDAKESRVAAKPAAEPAEKGHGGGHGTAPAPKEAAPAPKWKLKELAPIVTNLAAPETGWVRLQAAMVYDGDAEPHPDVMVSQVTADIVAFLRTLTLASIEGADGLRRLQEDLSERAAIRSEGHIRELVIQALVVQ